MEVEAVAGRRGSLAISEIHDWWPVVTSGPTAQYTQAVYIEVYNNSASTLYLDGKILGEGFWHVRESELNASSLNNCAEFESWRMDPLVSGQSNTCAFRGPVASYPLAPHEAQVVATQAIDHREVHPELGLPDLRWPTLRS